MTVQASLTEIPLLTPVEHMLRPPASCTSLNVTIQILATPLTLQRIGSKHQHELTCCQHI